MTETEADIPRTIWFVWFQGLENAPYVVRKCHESWIARNPGWRVETLDAATLPRFASTDYSSYSSGNIGALGWQHKAGLLRFDLLAHHGGVWADATCFCMLPLDRWLPQQMESGFFAFRRPGPDRIISSWFLAAKRDNLLVTRLFAWLLDYWRDHPLRTKERQLLARVLTKLLQVSPRTRAWWFSPVVRDWLAVGPYYSLSYALEKLIREDPECARIWARTSALDADGPHRLSEAGLLSPATDSIRAEIDNRKVPVYKTTWRVNGQQAPAGSVLSYLLEMERT
jgi:Capsular polysaccharide synthesis protein